MITLQELRGMSDQELDTELKKAQKKLMELTMKKSIGQLKETHEVRANRKVVAQIKTLQKENMIAEAEQLMKQINQSND